MRKSTQEQQVIDCLRKEGGFATFRKLYEVMDFSSWKSKTPEASVRRIVQNSKEIFRIQPGLWALEEARDVVLQRFDLKIGNQKSEEIFTHGYYQGLLVEIGKFQHRMTYVPAQDKSRLFLGRHLGEVSDTTVLPSFTYDDILRKARTVDVIWFNQRQMPSEFYEVEHTTDIKNSLSKFYELQDFNSCFYIVANESRRKEYEDKLHVSMFEPIRERVCFLSYDRVVKMYSGVEEIERVKW